MPRLPRIVIPHIAHHVTQRGNRRQKTFFTDDDYENYLQLMSLACKKYHTKILAYCLMPNHIHLVAVPETKLSLRYAVGDAHENYSKFINRRNGWQGHLWQGRFFSAPMDNEHMLRCVRYVEMNPVRANLCTCPFDYRWSSARAHHKQINDILVDVEFLLGQVGNWNDFLGASDTLEQYEILRQNSRTGRPLGSKCFLEQLEKETGISLIKKQKRTNEQ